MQKITPFLWFNGNAEEAVKFYTSVFSESKVNSIVRFKQGDQGPEGLVASFSLHGQSFTALNGGPQFKFTEAISFVVNCESQKEVDMYWDKLSEGGQKQQCGWLKDKFGLSWQIVPTVLPKLMGSNDERSQRAMNELMKMDKIDIAKLERAYEGK